VIVAVNEAGPAANMIGVVLFTVNDVAKLSGSAPMSCEPFTKTLSPLFQEIGEASVMVLVPKLTADI
jgi:hypothetical protein